MIEKLPDNFIKYFTANYDQMRIIEDKINEIIEALNKKASKIVKCEDCGGTDATCEVPHPDGQSIILLCEPCGYYRWMQT